jgi:hypothetical protein
MTFRVILCFCDLVAMIFLKSNPNNFQIAHNICIY